MHGIYANRLHLTSHGPGTSQVVEFLFLLSSTYPSRIAHRLESFANRQQTTTTTTTTTQSSLKCKLQAHRRLIFPLDFHFDRLTTSFSIPTLKDLKERKKTYKRKYFNWRCDCVSGATHLEDPHRDREKKPRSGTLKIENKPLLLPAPLSSMWLSRGPTKKQIVYPELNDVATFHCNIQSITLLLTGIKPSLLLLPGHL